MDIGSLSIILIVGLLLLISIGVPMGFASGFMGAVLVFLYIGEHALGILLSRYYSLVVTYSFLSVPLFIFSGMAMLKGGAALRLVKFATTPSKSTPILIWLSLIV